MLWKVYLRKEVVYLPTVAKTDAGYYLDIDPVEVVLAEDLDGLTRAIKQTLSRGNPPVPTPARDSFPRPAVLSHARVRTWSTFEKNTLLWEIDNKASTFHMRLSRKSADGGWDDDPSALSISGTTIDEFAAKAAAEIQMASKSASSRGWFRKARVGRIEPKA